MCLGVWACVYTCLWSVVLYPFLPYIERQDLPDPASSNLATYSFQFQEFSSSSSSVGIASDLPHPAYVGPSLYPHFDFWAVSPAPLVIFLIKTFSLCSKAFMEIVMLFSNAWSIRSQDHNKRPNLQLLITTELHKTLEAMRICLKIQVMGLDRWPGC